MAEQEFNELLSTIEKINQQMANLVNRINQVKTSLTQLQEPAARESAGRSLGGLQTALNRLEAKINQLNAEALRQASAARQGLEKGAPYGRVSGESIIGPAPVRQGLEAANVRGKLDAEVRKYAKGVAERFQQNLIEGMISARATILNEANQRQKSILETAIRDKQAVSAMQARIRAINQEYDAIESRTGGYRRPDFGRTAPLSSRATPVSSAETLVSHPESIGTPPWVSDLRRQLAQDSYKTYLTNQLDEQRRRRFTDLVPERGETLFPTNTQRKRVSLQEQLAQAEAQSLEEAKKLISAERKYSRALEIAAQQGYSPADLKRLRTRGTGGIEQLQFQRTDEYGRQRNLDLFVNSAGRATPGISNQFRTFGQGVVRDIGELTKWSIALAAVYGPMQKVSELTQIMIENQDRLAQAVTSVSSAFIGQDEIFDASAEAAERAGESISGVIDAFTQAYRASGGGANEAERFATAQNLLNASLTLSRLSTLDQAAAIDTLSAALRQSFTGEGSLQRGTELLDKWVRVTKIANVDLASLATGFAVLGDAAEAAQIDADQLNGILATIGETGVASGRELANTARAIVAGFQSDQARKALENIGVAVTDTTGQMRPFLEIMQELSNLRQTGALDDTAFSKLTLALGGGTRRQAAYATFIENFERVGQVAAESVNAQGDAQAALARQLETVQTSLTRLGNAFQELAQSLGTEGGFLGLITESIDGTTALVKIFDSLVSVLGKATPAMAAFVAASLILKQQGRGGLQEAILGTGKGFLTTPQQLEEQALFQRLGAPVPLRQKFSQSFGQNILGTNASSGLMQGLATALIPAILNATNKEDRFGGTKAVANVVGGVGGGIVGALVAGSPVIGAAVGVAISEAFVNSTIARKTDIFGYQTGPQAGEGIRPTGTATDLDKALEKAEIGLYESIGFGNESIGRFISAQPYTDRAMLDRLNDAIESGNERGLENVLKRNKTELENVGITPELARQAFKEGQAIEISPENRAYRLASEEARRAYDEALAARVAQGGTPLDTSTAFSKLVEQNRTNFESLIETVKESSQEQLRRDRISGDVRGAEYGRRTESLGGFGTRALQYYTALGDQVNVLTDGSDDAARAFEILNNVIVGGSEEALPQLTSLSSEIQNITNLLAQPELNKKALADLGGVEGATEKLKDYQQTLATILSDINQQVLVSRIDIPDVQGDINKPLSTPDFNLVKQRATNLQDEFYQGFLQIPDDMYDALKDSWEEWAQIVEDSGDIFYEKVNAIDPQFFQQAMQQLIEENKLASQAANPFGIQQLDISSQQGSGLQGMIDYFSSYLSQNFPQYEQKPEEFGVIFNDYVTSVLHGDNLAVKLALEKLVDINQKQLDGMYNIPEGATFWVPLTAAYYRPQNQGGAGGLPDVGDTENTQATKENTQALRELAQGFRGDLGYSRQAQENLKNAQRADPTAFKGDLGYSRQAEEDRKLAVGFRGDLGYSRAGVQVQEEKSNFSTFLQTLETWFRNLLNSGGDFNPNSGSRGRGPGEIGEPQSYRGLGTQPTAQQINPQVNARLELQIDSTTQLVVDGRVLASVISPYLANELVRIEASQGTITKRYVI